MPSGVAAEATVTVLVELPLVELPAAVCTPVAPFAAADAAAAWPLPAACTAVVPMRVPARTRAAVRAAGRTPVVDRIPVAAIAAADRTPAAAIAAADRTPAAATAAATATAATPTGGVATAATATATAGIPAAAGGARDGG